MAFTLFDAITGGVATGAQLDANLATLGQQSISPCSVAGTNILTLTQFSSSPIITSYSNFLRLTGVAVATNTTTVTAQVGTLPALNIYKDSPAGPVLLTGGEIVNNNEFTISYDSALAGGAGGWHLLVLTQVLYLPLAGGTLTGPLFGTSVTMSGAATVDSLRITGLTSGSSLAMSSATVGTETVTGGASIATLTIGNSGCTISGVYSTNASISMSLASNASGYSIVPLAGCSIGDMAIVAPPANSYGLGITWNAWVSSAGSVAVVGHAPGGGANQSLATFHIAAIRVIP